jgi:hypothetical protein
MIGKRLVISLDQILPVAASAGKDGFRAPADHQQDKGFCIKSAFRILNGLFTHEDFTWQTESSYLA